MGCTHGAAKATSKPGASQSLPSHCTGCSQQGKIHVKSVLPALPRVGDVAPIEAKHLQGCLSITVGGSPQLVLHPQARCLGGVAQLVGTPWVGSHTGHTLNSVPLMPSHCRGSSLPVGLCAPVPPCWSCSPGVAAFPLPEPCIPSKATCFRRSPSLTRLSQTAFTLLHPIAALCHPS